MIKSREAPNPFTATHRKLVWLTLVLLVAAVLAFTGLLVFTPRGQLLAPAGLLLLILTILIFRSPFFGLQVLLLVMLTIWLSQIKLLGEGLSLTPLIGALVLASWFARLLLRKETFVMKREYIWLLIFIALGFIEVLGSAYRSESAAAWFTYMQLALAVVVMVSFGTTPAKLRQLGWVIVIAAFALSVAILLDGLGWLPNGLVTQMLGERLPGQDQGILRAAGAWGDPNFTAMQISLGLAFAFEFFTTSRNLVVRLLLALGLVISVIVIVLTYSMGGLLGLVTMALAKLVLSWRAGSVRMRVAITLLLVMGALAMVSFTSADYKDRVLAKLTDTFDTFSAPTSDNLIYLGTKRGAAWTAALAVFASKPWGVGPGVSEKYLTIADPLRRGSLQLATHNMFLAIAIEFGLMGFLIFTGLLLWTLRQLRFRANRLESGPAQVDLDLVRRALLVTWSGFLVQALLLNAETFKGTWILLGMTLAYGYVARAYQAITRETHKEAS